MNLIIIFNNWLEAIKKYDLLKLDFERLQIENSTLKIQNKGLEKQRIELIKTIDDMDDEIDKLNEVKHSVDDAIFWNNKWEKNTVFYSAPKRKKIIEYLADRQISQVLAISNIIISLYNLVPNLPDKVPLAVMRWIDSQKFPYKFDNKETWNTPEQTFNAKYTDCDDLMILSYYISRQIFKDLNIWDKVRHRLKCCDGNVYYLGTIPVYGGRHAFGMWLADDGEWYVWETTWMISRSINLWLKKPMKVRPEYGRINYTFNDQYSWATTNIAIDNKIYQKFK